MKTDHAEKGVPMVQDFSESYRAETRDDGGLSIHIEVAPRYVKLWLAKLSDLRASDEDIDRHEPE
jgi:hypothetical protein